VPLVEILSLVSVVLKINYDSSDIENVKKVREYRIGSDTIDFGQSE
jgi:hypothetical protein